MFDSIKTALMAVRFQRNLRGNRAGKLSAENVGYGLAIGGGLMALAVAIGILFIPVATFPTIDAEMGAFIAAILFVAGILVHAAD